MGNISDIFQLVLGDATFTRRSEFVETMQSFAYSLLDGEPCSIKSVQHTDITEDSMQSATIPVELQESFTIHVCTWFVMLIIMQESICAYVYTFKKVC